MKKIFKFAAIVAAAAALFSCQEKPTPEPTPDPEKPNQEQPETPQINENIKFTIELTEVTENTAKFKVKHDGAKTDTWHYVATTESDIEAAIEAEVAAKKNPQSSQSKTVTVRGLQPETQYTFVVFGLTKEGVVYGTPVTAEFKTAAEPVEEFQVNPAWTVSYIGEYEEGGKVYDNVVTVEATDTNPYFVTAWPVDMYAENGIETITALEIEAWNEVLAANPGATWADIVYSGSILAQVGIDPEYGTKWYAIVIGCDTNGQPTGLYALSEVIDLENLGGEEEEPTAEYAAWIGDWTFTGANGVAFDVTMKKGKANQTYKLTGWEGPESEGLDITVEWMAEDGIWAIFAQLFGTFDFGSYGEGPVYLVPQDADGYIYPKEGVPACIGGFTEDGQRMVIGYSEETEDGLIEMVTMMYLANLQSEWYTITSVKEWPTFPLTVTPATKATTTAVKEFKGGKKTLNPLAPKTFNAFSLCDMSVRTF